MHPSTTTTPSSTATPSSVTNTSILPITDAGTSANYLFPTRRIVGRRWFAGGGGADVAGAVARPCIVILTS
eukprot:CAMPEP_0201880922 /NCGR_PEP_ID=MMETSP0902-20130614/11387_1 /ASSEMBLY_ACC=CAM_ASM_000551 /TAXON_ID=420261 /ORGANISM="Thalassiosira antarctica, Strain CCMP982" /LENGTH=70 /DNA_ID=CAMNT_0048409025 /DNA_START=86 /DNA_END=295 /DNA_ORIENTATION=-